MNNLIPNEFKINGDLVIRIEKESLISLAAVVVFIVVIALIAQRILKK